GRAGWGRRGDPRAPGRPESFRQPPVRAWLDPHPGEPCSDPTHALAWAQPHEAPAPRPTRRPGASRAARAARRRLEYSVPPPPATAARLAAWHDGRTASLRLAGPAACGPRTCRKTGPHGGEHAPNLDLVDRSRALERGVRGQAPDDHHGARPVQA